MTVRWNIPNFFGGVFKSEVSVNAGRIAARGKMSHSDVASHAFFLRQKAMPQSQCDKLHFATPPCAGGCRTLSRSEVSTVKWKAAKAYGLRSVTVIGLRSEAHKGPYAKPDVCAKRSAGGR